MHRNKPIIGITPGFEYDKDRMFINRGYCDAINLSGGIAVLLPLCTSEDLLYDILNRFDGFLISGGPDIDAKYFGQQNLNCSGEISPYRDYMEVTLIKKAIENNKPLFGICRGAQVINVSMGGTIYQDIFAQMKDYDLIKHYQSAPTWYATHDIYIENASRIKDSFKTDYIRVNSFHHQAIKDIPDRFRITSRSPDGIIESIEHNDHIFAVGVQWHPELMWREDKIYLNLFKEFVNCCK